MTTILVADDNHHYREDMVEILRLEGYDAVGAKDGVEALDNIRQSQPDVVLCDIDMPLMDGLELLRRVRADADLQDVPFIMVTGNDISKQREAEQAKANGFLQKPITIDKLLAAVKKVIE